jgi:hypothetical protein
LVFEGLDGSFRCVDAVIVGLNKLNGAVAGGDNFFNGGRGLIVCDIEDGSKSFFHEGVEDCAGR